MLVDMCAHASVLLVRHLRNRTWTRSSLRCPGDDRSGSHPSSDSLLEMSEVCTIFSQQPARLLTTELTTGVQLQGDDVDDRQDAIPMNPRHDRDGQGPSRWHRDVDRAALFAFVPALATVPLWLVAMVVLWLPIGAFTDIPAWWVMVGYLTTGILLFLPWTQRRLLTLLIGARRPTNSEATKLQKAFDEVTQAWHIKGRRYVVGVVDDDDINAFACGGHLVVVTSYAAQNLTHQELCGVLAHELCHHLGSHTVALTINQWLTLPIYTIARLGYFLNNVSVAATRAFAKNSTLANTAGNIIAGVFSVLSWIFASGFSAAQSLNSWVGRSAEFQADQRVVRLGYGKQLAAALRRTQPSTRVSRTHPPARTRIARIEASLRQQSTTSTLR